MGWERAVTAVHDRMRSGWTDAAVPVLLRNGEGLDNRPFHPPVATPWLFVELRWNGGGGGSIDGVMRRREGHIWLHAFVPYGTGITEAHRLTAAAAALFEQQDVSGVVCADALPGGESSASIPSQIKGSWDGESVSIPFTFDEVFHS